MNAGAAADFAVDFAVEFGRAEQIEHSISMAPATDASRRAGPMAMVLVPQNRRGIGIFSKGLGIALGENFHHPVMEIIHGMILNRAEAAVVFFAGFINVTAQPVTDVFVFASQANVLGPQ